MCGTRAAVAYSAVLCFTESVFTDVCEHFLTPPAAMSHAGLLWLSHSPATVPPYAWASHVPHGCGGLLLYLKAL